MSIVDSNKNIDRLNQLTEQLNTQVGFENSGIFTNPSDQSKVIQSKYSAHYEVPNLSSSKYFRMLLICVIVLYEYTMKE